MPVGTGSIKRAATKATVGKRGAAGEGGKTAATVKTGGTATPEKARSAGGSGKKTPAKKTTVKSATIASVSPEVVEKMQLGKQPTEKQPAGKQQFCHLTEDLPVHLL